MARVIVESISFRDGSIASSLREHIVGHRP